MPYDRKTFYSRVRLTLFNGRLSQRQVDGMEHLLNVWEKYFEKKAGSNSQCWLAYALATTFHETAYLMVPIEEFGKGKGKPYGKPVGPYNEKYYGRGHVQLTWESNYKKGERFLKEKYNVAAPMHQFPQEMLEDITSALVMYDGMIAGWFTGVGLPRYFDVSKKLEDAYNARKIINGLDKAATIKGYYNDFKPALVPIR